MHCVNCGAALADDAKFCGSCGTPVGAVAGAAPDPGAPTTKTSGKGKKLLWIIIGIFAVIFLLARCGGSDVADTNSASDPAPEAAATPVTAVELFRAYQANEAAAQQQYGDRPLEVSGTVDGVDLDFSDEPFIKLRTDNQFMPAQAKLIAADQPKASSLSKGSSVRLRCESVSEIVGTPMLKDCRIL